MMEGQGKLFLLPLAASPSLIVSGVGVCFLGPAGDLVSVSVSWSHRTQDAIWSWSLRVTFSTWFQFIRWSRCPPTRSRMSTWSARRSSSSPSSSEPPGSTSSQRWAKGGDQLKPTTFILFSRPQDWFLPALCSLLLSLLKWGGRQFMSWITPPPPPREAACPRCPPTRGLWPRPRTRWRSATGTNACPWLSSRRWRKLTISRNLW